MGSTAHASPNVFRSKHEKENVRQLAQHRRTSRQRSNSELYRFRSSGIHPNDRSIRKPEQGEAWLVAEEPRFDRSAACPFSDCSSSPDARGVLNTTHNFFYGSGFLVLFQQGAVTGFRTFARSVARTALAPAVCLLRSSTLIWPCSSNRKCNFWRGAGLILPRRAPSMPLPPANAALVRLEMASASCSAPA